MKKRFWVNLLLYLTLVLGYLYLSFPFTATHGNEPHARVRFVYERF